MIKNIIGAAMGAQLAKKLPNVGNGTGAVLGSVAPLALARLSLPALVAIGAGGYLFKRYRGKQDTAGSGSAGKTRAAEVKTQPANAAAPDPAI